MQKKKKPQPPAQDPRGAVRKADVQKQAHPTAGRAPQEPAGGCDNVVRGVRQAFGLEVT